MICRALKTYLLGNFVYDYVNECQRAATRYIVDGETVITVVCGRHAVWYQRHGYEVRDL